MFSAFQELFGDQVLDLTPFGAAILLRATQKKRLHLHPLHLQDLDQQQVSFSQETQNEIFYGYFQWGHTFSMTYFSLF